MTGHHKPFAFDRVFAPDGTVLRDGDQVKRMLTEAEAAEREAAAADAARRSEEAESAKAAADALRQLAGRMQAVIARMDGESEQMRADAARLAVTAAKVIAGKALEHYAEDTIEACAKEALEDLRAEPRLAVRVAPHLADPIAERLYAAAEKSGFDGAVVVRADEEVSTGDVVLEWRAGAIERTAAQIETRISEAVEKWLARPEDAAEPDAPADDETHDTDNAEPEAGAA